MQLVNAHRRFECILLLFLSHPFLVLPCIVQIPDDRRLFRGDLIEEGKWIGFIHLIVILV